MSNYFRLLLIIVFSSLLISCKPSYPIPDRNYIKQDLYVDLPSSVVIEYYNEEHGMDDSYFLRFRLNNYELDSLISSLDLKSNQFNADNTYLLNYSDKNWGINKYPNISVASTMKNHLVYNLGYVPVNTDESLIFLMIHEI